MMDVGLLGAWAIRMVHFIIVHIVDVSVKSFVRDLIIFFIMSISRKEHSMFFYQKESNEIIKN